MEMPLIKGYRPGSDITIMNTWYEYGEKDSNGKYGNPRVTIVYKDNATGLKSHQTIVNPDYEFYVLNDDVYVDPDTFTDNIPLDQVHQVRCKYKDLEATIADLTGNKEEYWTNIKNGRRSENRKLHINNCIFQTDQNIEDHYRYRFDKQYTNNIETISKGYIDIEADAINALTDFPSPQDSPVNAVTYIDSANNQCYTFLLRDKDNKKMVEFEKNINSAMFNKLKAFIFNQVGGWKQAKRLGIYDLQYNFLIYDEEIIMLSELFKLINKTSPDFLLAWNMAFDIPYIIERIKVLGYDPKDILCDESFEYKVCDYYIDERNMQDPEERGDFARIASNTVYLDQLIGFRSRRKGQSKFPSYKLDDIGNEIAGVRKVDYHHICDSIVKLPRADYETFVFYNIIDVIVQMCIENKVQDIEYIFGKAVVNCTRYSKIHRQTAYLTNRRAKAYNSYGLAASNNGNAFNNKPTEKYVGAFVASPALLSDTYKIKINGIPINAVENADDFDYTALYPSTARENNMGNDTMIGKIFIPEALFDKDNRFGTSRYNRGGAFIEDLQCQNYLEFGTRWFNLADYSTLIDDITEYCRTMSLTGNTRQIYYDDNGLYRYKEPAFKVLEEAPKYKPPGFVQYNGEVPRRVGFIQHKPYNFEEINTFIDNFEYKL